MNNPYDPAREARIAARLMRYVIAIMCLIIPTVGILLWVASCSA